MPDQLVGIDDHVDEVMDMLDIEVEDVRIVGIWGMGGVGKTTLAKFVYNQLIDHFEYSCFLSNIREKSRQPRGMESLQSQLLSDILRHKLDEFADVDKGRGILKYRLPCERVLILLDDVDRTEQLSHMLPCLDKFAPGSRILVTTRDKTVMDEFQVERIYRVPEMNRDDALVLFCKHAFRQNFPLPDEFGDLSREIAKATGGLPLAIEVIGRYLSRKLDKDVWLEALELLKKEDGIQKRLRISFDALIDDEREIFLDIACLFAGTDHRVLAHMWKACGYSPASVIQDLCLRSLIKIDDDKKVWMHDLIKDLGREIVREESYNVPGERSRLWRHQDAIKVLENEEGTSKVKAIHLDHGLEEEEKQFQGQEFENLKMLLLLNLGDANLDGSFKGRLRRLKWLSWHGHTLLNIPHGLHLKDLVVLDLSMSIMTTDWIGWSYIQVLVELEVVNLTSCHHLTGTPDFSSFPPIKRLILEDCRALVSVHQSIRHLTTLESLNLKNCCSLERLPEELGSLSSLTELVVDGTLIQELLISAGMSSLKTLSAKWCRSLIEIPPSVRELQLLEELNLSHTSVEHLPDFTENLSNLKVLDVSHSSLRNFPGSLWKLQKLEVLNASNCQSLAGSISSKFGSPTRLRILRLNNTKVSEIPSGLLRLGHLETLDLKRCYELWSLPELPLSLVNLKLTCQSFERAFRILPVQSLAEKGKNRLPSPVCLKQLDILGCNWENIDVLARLKELSIGECPRLRSIPQLQSSLRHLQLSGLDSLVRLPNLSHLKNLSRLSLLKCPVVEIPGLGDLLSLKTLRISSPLINLNGLEHLSSLSYLWVEGCKFKSLPDLSELKEILEITLKDCRDLIEIQGLSSLDTLTSLSIIGCKSLRSLPYLRDQKLKSLKLEGLELITKIFAIGKSSSLEILHISRCGQVTDLLDLSSFHKLKQLKLRECWNLRLVPELKGFASLEILDVGFQEIEMLSDLSSLHKLTQLKIDGCSQLREIPALTELVSLKILHIRQCGAIKKLSNISSLDKLKQLKIEGCSQLGKIPALMGLVSLEMLNIRQCEIVKLPDLSSLHKLKELRLCQCMNLLQVPELTGLASLELLEIIDCPEIKKLPNLSSLQRLKQLNLNLWIWPGQVSGFTGLTSLEILNIYNCQVMESLPDLSSLHKLKELNLHDCNRLQHIPALTALTSLEILCIFGCSNIEMLPDLSWLYNLKEFRATQCEHLLKIQGLGNLVSLEVLDISGCRVVKELPDLSKLEKLRELHLYGCRRLVGIEGLGELVYLLILDLAWCEEIKEIPDLSRLSRLTELTLSSHHRQLLRGTLTIFPKFV